VLCLVVAGTVAVLRACAYTPLPMAEIAELSLPEARAEAADREYPFLLEEARAAMGYRWDGAFHVHSRRSDGSGTVAEIAAAAAAVGLDFVVLTDHNPIGERGRPEPGWYGDVLVVVGEELSTAEGHLVALGLPPHRYRLAPRAFQAVQDVEELGGWVIAAHPSHEEVPWTGGWGLPEGLEAVSLTDRWSSLSLPRKAAVVGLWPFADDYAAVRLLARPAATLEAFDRLTALSPEARGSDTAPRPRVMVGAADAHGNVGPTPWPGYENTFRAVQTAVWASRPPHPGRSAGESERLLLEALRGGRAAAVVTAVGTAPDFTFTARRSAGGATRWVLPGEMAPSERGPWRLRVDMGSPGPYELVLRRDGREVAATVGEPLETRVERPGTYRAEVYRARAPSGAGRRGSTPWIVSNAIYVWPGPARSAARVHPVPPLPAPPVERTLMPEPRWLEESSDHVAATLTRRPGVIEWEARLPGRPSPDAYAALAWRTRRQESEDWSDGHGVVLRLAAGSPVRLLVEIRARGADGRLRGWRTTAKAVPGGRTTPLPFSGWELGWEQGGGEVGEEGRTDGPGSPWEVIPGAPPRGFDADARRQVEGLFLVVTAGMLPGGSQARVRVEEAGLY